MVDNNPTITRYRGILVRITSSFLMKEKTIHNVETRDGSKPFHHTESKNPGPASFTMVAEDDPDLEIITRKELINQCLKQSIGRSDEELAEILRS